MTTIMHIEKWRPTVHFTDGSTEVGEWYVTDIYAKQFAMQYQDEPTYSHYTVDHAVFKEDMDLSVKESALAHPFNSSLEGGAPYVSSK